MKKKTMIIAVISLVAIIIALGVWFYVDRVAWHIDLEEVDYIVAHTHTTRAILDAEDQVRFVELYNMGTIGGRATGEGGTPDYGFGIHLNDGTDVFVNPFNKQHDFEVGAYYIENDALLRFAEMLIEEYCGGIS